MKDIELLNDDTELDLKSSSEKKQADFWSTARNIIKLQRQAPPLQSVPRNGKLPLSFAQERLWFLSQLEVTSSVYNYPAAFHLAGCLNFKVLQQSLHEIVARHEILRTTFPTVDSQPVQSISNHVNLDFESVDLQKLPVADREIRAQQIVAEEGKRSLDLTQEPGLRVKLLHLAPQEYIIVFARHHIAFDGSSFGIFFKELKVLYDAFIAGEPSPLPEIKIQYADFATWQRQWLQGEVLELQLQYWQDKLSGNVAPLQLPCDRPYPTVHNYRGASQFVELPSDLTKALVQLSQKQGVTLFITLLTAFKTLLYQYSQQEDILICSPVAGRNRLEIKDIIGYFNNILLMRTSLAGNPTFIELTNRVRQVALEAYQHQDVPFEKVAELPNLIRIPLATSSFVLQNYQNQPLELADIAVNPLPISSEASNFDLSLTMFEGGENLTALVRYKTSLFDAATIEQIMQNFETLLASLVANPQQHLQDLPALDRPSQKLESHNPAEKPSFVAPRNEIELKLTKIWEEVLDIQPISVTDNFFALGGRSLLAVRLFAEIEKVCDRSLPLATLFQAPTIEKLAEIIPQSGWSAPWSSLVQIKPGASPIPLFCIHAVGPSILNYQNLTPYLHPDLPVYGLQAQGLDGKQDPLNRIEDMAAHYITEIQTIQPQGPYLLLGHSFGGLMAFEMAQQLQRQRQEIGLLALIDTFNPISLQNKPNFLGKLRIHQTNLARLTATERKAYLTERLQWAVSRLSHKVTGKFFPQFATTSADELPEHYQKIEQADREATSKYIPQTYLGKLTLLRAIERPTKTEYDPYLGWKDLIEGEIEIHEVPGNHLSTIMEPQVKVVSSTVQSCIDKILN